MTSFLAGLGLGLSLIIAIGAQNVFILRQAIRREHVLAVVLICAISDAILIIIGVAGLGAIFESTPWLIDGARWFGAAFLIGYGLLAAMRAWRGNDKGLVVDEEDKPADAAKSNSLASVVLTALALTWLNPHVYLDTVILLGSISATHGEARWIFAAGAILASAIWFSALGFGARYLGRWLRTPRAWRILDACIAVVMILIAIGLLMPIFAR